MKCMKLSLYGGLARLAFAAFAASAFAVSSWGYTEQRSTSNDKPEDAENIGKIGSAGITIYGSCSVRWQMQDDDYYAFTPAGDTLYYTVPIKASSELNKLFIAIIDDVTWDAVVLCGEQTAATRSGSIKVTPNHKYYLHCYKQSHATDVSYQVTLSSNGNGGDGGDGDGGGGEVTKPDLRPYQPSDWPSSLVLSTSSSSTGSTSSSFTTEDNIYASFAVRSYDANTLFSFQTYIAVDGMIQKTWTHTGSLTTTEFWRVLHFNLGKLPAGTHTIKVMIDSWGDIAESNENNNTITRSITVREAAKTHTMTLYRNNSSGDGASARRTVTDNGYYTLPTISSLGWTRSGYTFKGWATYRGATSASYSDGERIYVGASMISLYAVWQSNVTKHVMTLYRNNSSGDGAGARRTVTEGSYYTLPTISSLGWARSGYTFKGWATYRGATTATYSDGARIYVSSSLTSLYAVWGSHVMTLYRNNSSGDGAGARRTVPDNGYYTLPTISSLGWTRSGYTFKGWATYRGATTATYSDGARIYVGSSLYSLYALWESTAAKYVVYLHRNNSAGDGATAGRTMVVGSWRNLPSIDELGWYRNGYTFEGWAYYSNATGYDVVYLDGENVCNLSYFNGDKVHLYAVWRARATGAKVFDELW